MHYIEICDKKLFHKDEKLIREIREKLDLITLTSKMLDLKMNWYWTTKSRNHVYADIKENYRTVFRLDLNCNKDSKLINIVLVEKPNSMNCKYYKSKHLSLLKVIDKTYKLLTEYINTNEEG